MKQKQFKPVTRTAWAVGPKFLFMYEMHRDAFLAAGFSGERVFRVRVTITPLPTRKAKSARRAK